MLYAVCPYCDRADDHYPRCPRSLASTVYDQLEVGDLTREEATEKVGEILLTSAR